MDELDGCEREVARLEADLMAAQTEIKALRQAVAITLTEINSNHGGWGRGTATLMARQLLRDYLYIQEVPPNARNALRDRIAPLLAPKEN